MPEKAAVIGSNSFSGSHLVDFLLLQGLEVLGVSRSLEPHPVFLPYRDNGRRDSFSFLQADLNLDFDRLLAALDSFQPGIVVNFAAQGMVAQSWQAPEQWLRTNTLAMVRLHEALRRRDYLKVFVQASTPEVYGDVSGRITEDAPYNPSTPYAVSKAACDMSLMAFVRNYRFPAVLTRSANVYGPGQQLYRIIPRTILAILTGGKLALQGGGNSLRSFIHIRDVAEATWLAARKAPAGSIVHLGTGTEISIRQLVETICGLMGADFSKTVDLVPARAGQDSAYRLDCAEARRLLDWQPKVSLQAGLEQTISWVKANLAVLREQPLEYTHKD